MGYRVTLILAFCLSFTDISGLFALTPGNASGAEETTLSESFRWGSGEYKKLKVALDFQYEALSQSGLFLQDVRISPIIRGEKWYEIPLELGFFSSEDMLLPFLKKQESFSFADAVLINRTISISPTSEIFPGKGTLLSVNLNQTFRCGIDPSRESDLEKKVRLTKGLAKLFEFTTFEPQVKKEAGGGAERFPHWLTSLRIDSDLRLQATGFAITFPALTGLAEELFRSGVFVDVYLTNATKNTFMRLPVWRFEIVGKIQ